MIAAIVLLTLVVLALAAAIVLGLAELHRFWEERAEQARIEGEVRRAERRLHALASNAFSSMLDTARQRRGGGSETRR